MTSSQRFCYLLSHPACWYRDLEAQGLGSFHDAVFELRPGLGDGQLLYMDFQEGLWLQQMDFVLQKPLYLMQESCSTNEIFILNFYLNNAHVSQDINGTVFDFQYDQVSAMLSSSTAPSAYDLAAQEQVRIFQVGFTRDWLLPNAFGENNPELRRMFEQNQPIYVSENLDFRFKHLLDEMDLKQSNRLQLFSNTLQLLNTFFHLLEQRTFKQPALGHIHHEDLERLLEVRGRIDTNPLVSVNLEALALQSGMSLSKFKRLFKQVFGTSPYHYQLKNRLSIAKEMLQERNYSVSEAGFLVGYSNLSQFAKAFKNQFGVLPSEVKA